MINSGYIVATGKSASTKEAEIQVLFEGGQIVFLHKKNKYTIMVRHGKFFCYHSPKGQSAQETVCSDYRHILGHILSLPKSDLNIQYGIMNIKDMPFLFYIIPNGFLFKLDVEEIMITYAIVHQENKIMLARQEGEWRFNDPEGKTHILAEFDNYHDALKTIYTEATDVIRTFLKNQPKIIN